MTWLVGAVIASSSSSDGNMLLVALAASSALVAVVHRVDWSPFCTCVRCPITVGVAFVGQYLATFSTLSPGNERKLPALTARRNVDLTGDPTVQCRYSMRFLVDGRSYAWRWYSVDRCGGLLVVAGRVGGADSIGVCVSDSYIVCGAAGMVSC